MAKDSVIVRPVEPGDTEQLRERFEQADAKGHRMLLQDIIPGPDELVVGCRGYAFDSGDISPLVPAVKLLQYPPIFGIGQLQQSRRAPLLEEYTRTLLHHVDFRGSIFGVEFKYDTRVDKWKFIEMNCRSLMSTGPRPAKRPLPSTCSQSACRAACSSSQAALRYASTFIPCWWQASRIAPNRSKLKAGCCRPTEVG